MEATKGGIPLNRDLFQPHGEPFHVGTGRMAELQLAQIAEAVAEEARAAGLGGHAWAWLPHARLFEDDGHPTGAGLGDYTLSFHPPRDEPNTPTGEPPCELLTATYGRLGPPASPVFTHPAYMHTHADERLHTHTHHWPRGPLSISQVRRIKSNLCAEIARRRVMEPGGAVWQVPMPIYIAWHGRLTDPPIPRIPPTRWGPIPVSPTTEAIEIGHLWRQMDEDARRDGRPWAGRGAAITLHATIVAFHLNMLRDVEQDPHTPAPTDTLRAPHTPLTMTGPREIARDDRARLSAITPSQEGEDPPISTLRYLLELIDYLGACGDRHGPQTLRNIEMDPPLFTDQILTTMTSLRNRVDQQVRDGHAVLTPRR